MLSIVKKIWKKERAFKMIHNDNSIKQLLLPQSNSNFDASDISADTTFSDVCPCSCQYASRKF